MAQDLKAVVEITADTSGLVRGIDGATKKIAAGTSAMAEIAKFDTLQKSFEMIKAGFDMVSRRYDELYKTAIEYSPAAAAANENLELAKVYADMAKATAVAPGAIGVARINENAVAADARRVVNNADSINRGMVNMAATKANFAAQGDIAVEALGNALGGDFGGAFHALGGLLDSQNYVYADQAQPGRGMAGWSEMQEANAHLSAIREKMGGQ